jgi:hypothetical protein
MVRQEIQPKQEVVGQGVRLITQELALLVVMVELPVVVEVVVVVELPLVVQAVMVLQER